MAALTGLFCGDIVPWGWLPKQCGAWRGWRGWGDRVGALGVMALVAVRSWITGLCEYVSCVDDGRARSVVGCTGSLETLDCPWPPWYL